MTIGSNISNIAVESTFAPPYRSQAEFNSAFITVNQWKLRSATAHLLAINIH